MSLLPWNSSVMERAIEAAARLDLPVPIADLIDPDTCPEFMLPWLAWEMHVDGFDDIPTVQGKRAAIRMSLALHKKKGTKWAIQRALETYGYPGCKIIEHRDFMSEWLAAGGELLDGIGVLNGDGDLSAPSGMFRFATTHWAQYSLRLNAADGITTSAMLRQLAQLCAMYAPRRSHLAVILLFVALEFDATIRMGDLAQHGRFVMRDCRRITVPTFDTLDGCDLIGGETLLDTLDGDGTLDGSSNLLPERYTGEPLDGGQLSINIPRSRTRMCGTALGGPYIEPPETLDSIDTLDGRYTISGETLDGLDLLDGGDLRYPLLADHEDTLDGTSNLGEIDGPHHIWFRGIVRTRRGSTVTQEPL